MNVTAAAENLRKLFGWDITRLTEVVASVPPGAAGITFLPYLPGERTPNLLRGVGVFHRLSTALI
jgi:xylulokinase